MTRKRLLAAGTLLAAIACAGEPLGLPVPRARYELRTVNELPVPALVRTDVSRGYFGYVDSGSVEFMDDTSGFIAFSMHDVVHLDNGDSLTGGWQFRMPARLHLLGDRIIFDYRSRFFQPRYGWDFLGVDTVTVGRTGLVILGDSVLEQPRTVYYYTGQ